MKKILYIFALGFLMAPGASSAYTLSFTNTLPNKATIFAKFDGCDDKSVELEAQGSGSIESAATAAGEPCKLKSVYAQVTKETDGMETLNDSTGWAAQNGGAVGDASWTLSESQLECKDIDGKQYCMYVLEKSE